MPYRDDLVAAVARAEAAEQALAAERADREADKLRLEALEVELRDVRQGRGKPLTLLLLMLGVEFTAVVALAIGYLVVR